MTIAEASKHFRDLNYNERQLVTFQTCATAESLLEKLLEIDVQYQQTTTGTNVIPKVIIVESLVRKLRLLKNKIQYTYF